MTAYHVTVHGQGGLHGTLPCRSIRHYMLQPSIGIGRRSREVMREKEYEQQLRHEGFTRVFVWRDEANVFYPDHTHGGTTAHIILEGEIALTIQGRTQTFKAGDRCDVPANTVHSARIGTKGCQYIIGER